MKKFKPLAVGAAVAASSFLVSEIAFAIDYKVSGHVNRVIRWVDDGERSDVQHLDNSASETRFTIRGADDFDNRTYGFRLEAAYRSNPSFAVEAGESADSDDEGLEVRHADLYFSGNWGKVSLGQGEMATRGISRQTYSGTYQANGFDQRGFQEVDVNEKDGNDYSDVGSFVSNYDGRLTDRIRYDSPTLAGFVLSASWGDDNDTDVALRYAGEFGAIRVAAGIGYTENTDFDTESGKVEQGFDYTPDFDDDDPSDPRFTVFDSQGNYERWGGSVSAIWPEGWNATFAFAMAEVDDDCTTGIDTKPGCDTPFFDNESSYEHDNYYLSFGRANQDNWSWSINYGWSDFEYKEFGDEDKEAEYWGVGVQHFIPKLNIECYASYQMFEFDDDRSGGLDLEDVQIATLGIRLMFN